MRQKLNLLLVILWAGAGTTAFGAPSALAPVTLCCEHRADPLGIDVGCPQLGWTLQGDAARRGQRQTAYQIVVASTPEILARDQGDLWDSGQMASDETSGIAYAGKGLVSSQGVWWKVRVWDEDAGESAWSAPATWTMGVLNAADWGAARWIGAPDDIPPSVAGPKSRYETVLLRRGFEVRPGLRRALVHVCGLGQCEMTVNGTRAGDDLLGPGWTKYDRTCLYETVDITARLHPGQNALGLFLGNGMYLSHRGRYIKEQGWVFGPLQAIGSVRLEYGDGTVETVVTGDEWRAASGPITFSSVFGGEDFDARLAPKGWDAAGFDDSSWERARPSGGPGGTLVGASGSAPPIHTFETLLPVGKQELEPGVSVYDLGQNTSLIPRLRVRGPGGATVRIIPSELVKADGDIDDTMCQGKAWWSYTLDGTGERTWQPKFFYRGARYLKVECLPAPGQTARPEIESLEGVVVHSAAPGVGTFACSNDLFNRTHLLVRWAQRSNLMSVITDCPTREKLGWLEQYHLNGPALRYEWDLATLYEKGIRDMRDSQTSEGLVPSIAPEYVKFGGDNDRSPFRNSPEWGSALLVSAWQQYEFTGDSGLLRRSYADMARYAGYLDGRARGGIVDLGLGDWYDLGPKPPGYSQLTPKALTATAFYFYDHWILAQAARLLGKTDDAARHAQQAEAIRGAFNEKFFHAETDQYATGSQCANAIALVMGLVEPGRRAAVLDNLVKDVQAKGLTAGDVGYRYLLRALADGGRSDVIFAMNQGSDKPGYGLQLKMGATSLTEAWDAGRRSSQNHFMLGQINEWFYHDLAGIQPDPGAPGFRKIVIRPAVVGDLTEAKASYRSVRGPIRSEWSRAGRRLTLAVEIPPNTTATVFVPCADGGAAVTEGGRAVGPGDPFVKRVRREPGCEVFEVASGAYRFEAELAGE